MSGIARIILAGMLVLFPLALISCPNTQTNDEPRQPVTDDGTRDSGVTLQTIRYETTDGHTIVGTMVGVPDDGPAPVCLLVHMLGHNRDTFTEFQRRLALEGISSLAIDLRGHGQSIDGGTLDVRNFTRDEQWQDMVKDLRGGIDYLAEQGYTDGQRVGIVGASIGANLAVIAASDLAQETGSQQVACLVLLSPGLSYHSVEPVPRARELEYTPVLIVSAEADAQSYSGSQALSQAARGGRLRSLSGREHGTNMFDADDTLMDEVIDFLKLNLTATPQTEPAPDADEEAEEPVENDATEDEP